MRNIDRVSQACLALAPLARRARVETRRRARTIRRDVPATLRNRLGRLWRESLSLFVSFERGVRRNLGLRTIALLLALGLWAFVNVAQRGAAITINVPVGYRLLPGGLAIINQSPNSVRVEITGPRMLLSLIDPDRLIVRLPLGGVGVGQTVFKISPEMFHVPRKTYVTQVSPSQIVVDIDRVIERQIPTHVVFDGPPAGFRVVSVKMTPPVVTLRGPSRYLAHVDTVKTAPMRLSGKGEAESAVALVSPDDRVRIVGARVVKAQVTVAEVIVDRTFYGLPVEVRDNDLGTKVVPQRISVILRGSIASLSAVDPRGSVYVEAHGLEPGWRELPVRVSLPNGVQLVRADPDYVRVRIYRIKNR